MKLPFTNDQFFQVILEYNQSIFPFQLVIIAAGFFAVWLLFRKKSIADKYITSFLGFLWIWIGIVYHFIFFTTINPAAYGFGALFIIQGILTLQRLYAKKQLNFISKAGLKSYTGYFFIAYGLILYPAISFLTEQSMPKTIALGLPCPSTIMTFGFFILAAQKFPKHLLVIPVIWAVIGISAALNIGVIQDLMIIVAAVVACIFIFKVKN